jgi:hypothetical protein
MTLTLEVEQADMDAFGRLLDAALKGSGLAVLPDASAWMNRMQTAITEAQKPVEETHNG